MISNGLNKKETGFVNIDNDDSDADDETENSSESDFDEAENFEEENIESSSSEQDLGDIREDESSEPVINIGQGAPYIRKANRNAPKKPLPFGRKEKEMKTADFEQEISDLKKEIQRMKALGEAESSEEDDKESERDQETSDLIKKIKKFRDEIKIEHGLPIESESSEEVNDENTDDDDASNDNFNDEYSEEFEGESFEDGNDDIIDDDTDDIIDDDKDDIIDDDTDDIIDDENDDIIDDDTDDFIEDEAENDEESSEEINGIKNVKLTQTFDGQDEISSNQDEDEIENSETIDELVKVIKVLKDQIIDQREKEVEAFIQGLVHNEMFESEESADEKLLAIFKELEVNEDLKDIKHFNDENDGEQKPFLEIEQPANLESDEVKIGFVISNEEENSQEKKIDLIEGGSDVIPQRVAEIEIVPIFVELQPFEFPKMNVVEVVEVVEIPDNDVLKAGEVYNVEKKSEVAKKNVPENIMSGGIISKVGSIFDFVKKHFS